MKRYRNVKLDTGPDHGKRIGLLSEDDGLSAEDSYLSDAGSNRIINEIMVPVLRD